MPVEDWQNETISLSVGIDVTTGADYLEIHYTPEYSHPSSPDDPVEFDVRIADIEDIERGRWEYLESGVVPDYDPVEKYEREAGLRPRTPPRLYLTIASPPPTPPTSPPEPMESPTIATTGSGAWIAREARRMKADGEIPQGIIKAAWARLLAKQMRNAAKTDASIRPITWPSINNKLRDWGLWPFDKI